MQRVPGRFPSRDRQPRRLFLRCRSRPAGESARIPRAATERDQTNLFHAGVVESRGRPLIHDGGLICRIAISRSRRSSLSSAGCANTVGSGRLLDRPFCVLLSAVFYLVRFTK